MSACCSTFTMCKLNNSPISHTFANKRSLKRSPSISQLFIILALTTVMTFILAVLQDWQSLHCLHEKHDGEPVLLRHSPGQYLQSSQTTRTWFSEALQQPSMREHGHKDMEGLLNAMNSPALSATT
ncbi:hypothetical protein T01_3482 [Trichinella spiralis]|uniref:Uncharacterized protein n=1 Tax=Trichinella spiralis TaxID=6334 RepID=A0A0V1B6U9_TRISP|nr:hypothetical protein T01_3482 [Trichinella spiralis]